MKGFQKNPKVVAREAEGEHFLIPVGENIKDINTVFRLNQLGWFIWQRLEEMEDMDQLVSLICKEFTVENAAAKRDAQQFLEGLVKSGALLKDKGTQ